jgi:hypothetical protein
MYHDEMEVMIPRAEVELFHTAIQSALAKADPEFGFEIMGSFRRGETISSDVDMVVWHPSVLYTFATRVADIIDRSCCAIPRSAKPVSALKA